MNLKTIMISFLLASLLTCLLNCKEDEATPDPPDEETDTFYFGADLSYVNQILDHGGVYKDQGTVKSPYKIFHDHGTNLVRLRLWHNPLWTKEVYGDDGTQLYNDLADVEKAIRLAKEQGMEVLLDFHYSDTWADPGNQKIPQAWKDITTLAVLKDSVYNYTHKVLQYLDDKDLMPELVQIGNETNCGMLYTDALTNFPACNVCDGAWQNMGEVVNRAIAAIKDVATSSTIKTKIILHVADPKNVEWWFDNMKNNGGVTGFDIIGFSYYPLWHTTVSLDQLADKVATFKSKYDKDVMIMETAYPWTTAAEDGYAKIGRAHV